MAGVLMYARNCVVYSLHHHMAAVIWNAEKDGLANRYQECIIIFYYTLA